MQTLVSDDEFPECPQLHFADELDLNLVRSGGQHFPFAVQSVTGRHRLLLGPCLTEGHEVITQSHAAPTYPRVTPCLCSKIAKGESDALTPGSPSHPGALDRP